MIDPTRLDPLAYVTAACPAMGLSFPDPRLVDLAEAFALVMRVSLPALQMSVPPDAEPAPVFVP